MRAVSKHALERMATIAIMGASLRIGPRQFPEIYAMLLETCEVFDMQVVPEFYAEPGGDIFTESLGVENPVIGFSAECLGKIDYEEQVFALGRELGHIKSGHNLYMLLKLVLRNETFMHRILSTIPGIGSAYETMNSALGIALTQWEWSSDYTVDRAGLLCCQDIDVALSCMIKMAGAPEKYYSQINIEAFREQVREFEIHTANLKNKAIKAWLASINKDDDGKIPMWTVTRAHELVKWYESGAYQRVLDRMPFVSEEIPDDDEPEKSFFENLKDKVGLGAGKIDPGNLFCPECGSPNDGVSSFCQQCGKPL